MPVIINICDDNDFMLHLFELIKCIFIRENESFIIYTLLFNLLFIMMNIFGAFNVMLTSELKCIKLNELNNCFSVHHISIMELCL